MRYFVIYKFKLRKLSNLKVKMASSITENLVPESESADDDIGYNSEPDSEDLTVVKSDEEPFLKQPEVLYDK